MFSPEETAPEGEEARERNFFEPWKNNLYYLKRSALSKLGFCINLNSY